MADDIEIKLTLDDQGIVRGFQQVGQEFKKFESGLTSAERAGTLFGNSLASAIGNVAANAITKLSSALIGLPGQLADLVSRGADIDDVTNAFQRLTSEAGGVASVFQDQLRAATAGTITDFELLREANENLRAGIKPDELIELTKAARVLADETGQDLKQSLDEITQSFINGQPRMLQNRLGVIDLKQAQEDLAKQLGVTADKLSKEGQVYAARQAILDATRQKLEKTGEAAVDAADNLQQISVALKNARDKFALAVAQNESLNIALQNLAQYIKDVDFSPLITGLTEVIKFVGTGTTALGELIGGTITDFKKAAALGATPELNKALEHVVDLLSKDTPKATKAAITQFEFLKKEILANKNVTLAYADDLLTIDSQIKASAKNFGIFIKANEDAARAVKGLKNETNGNPTGSLAPRLVELSDAANNKTTPALAELARQMAEVQSGAVQTTFSADDLAQSIAGLGDVTNQVAEGLPKLDLGGMLSEAFGFGDGASGDFNSILGSLTGAIESAFSAKTGEDFRRITSDLARDIGTQFAGPVGGAIASGITKVVFDAFGGGDSEGTKVRKAADKFFAEIFDADRLSVIINGQLKQIKDLDFGGDNFGNPEAGFFDIFKGLPEAAQAAFGGVGRAFAELLGNTQGYGASLGAVFATNLGGSLNNLQLLIQATGKSAEDLKNAVVEAFLDGKVSALEAQTAINGINQAMQEGIPDAVGAISQAFDNLKAAGVKGGRASTDALRDIGAEAKELGQTTFTEVINKLVETGQYSAEEIQQVFDALKAVGIDTVEELANATDQTLIGALSQLQAVEFPFAEAAEDAQELIDKVQNLPDEIRTRLVFDVQTNISDADRQVVSKSREASGAIGNSNSGL